MKDNGIQIYRLSIEVKKRLLSYNEARGRYAQFTVWVIICSLLRTGADPGFPVRGGGLKKIAPSGGWRENLRVFRVKNHDFTPKNHIFSNFRGGVGPPPLDSPLENLTVTMKCKVAIQTLFLYFYLFLRFTLSVIFDSPHVHYTTSLCH
jgi:hypothetical protein